MVYRILVDDRKQAVRRMEALTGEKATYTGMPRMAYTLCGVVVEKDGRITPEGDVRTEILDALLAEGLITKEDETGSMDETDTENTPATNEGTVMEEAGEDTAETEEVNEEAQGGEETAPASEDAGPEQVRPSVSFPISSHRADSLINLVNTLFSRGKLLSKATGGEFSASKELVDALNHARGRAATDDVLTLIREAGGLKGITFEANRVTFDGFPATEDPDTIKAWTVLSTAINKSAIKQNNVRAKEVDETNEKFAFRTWLTRLGMNGSDLKKERNILYRNLTGHTAFRTPADEEKWKARQAEKRAELKSAKEAEESEFQENGAEE